MTKNEKKTQHKILTTTMQTRPNGDWVEKVVGHKGLLAEDHPEGEGT